MRRKNILMHGYGKDKKLPTIDALKQEWATLAAEKKKLYSDYIYAKSNMTELLTAKSNAEKILGTKPETRRERNASGAKYRLLSSRSRTPKAGLAV
jgi:hypothetical protein